MTVTRFSLVVTLFLATTSVVAQEAAPPKPVVDTAAYEFVPQVERIEFDMAKVATLPALSPDALKGRTAFVKYCDFCHDGRTRTGGSTGPWLNGELVTKRGDPAVAAKIMTQSPGSRMPGFRYSLTTTEVDQLVSYLKSVGSDVKPLSAAGAARPDPE